MIRGLFVLAIACSIAACAAPEPGAEFVARDEDFERFLEWPSFELPPGSLTMAHEDGATRRLYFTHVPESASAPFPVGTILVKTAELGEPSTWEIHAMVKRGGDFNATGARGWEFFDLAIDASGGVVVVWRGESPPPGAGYPGSSDGACNSCHTLVPDRDYVFDRSLFD
ncbi:hypothetical protein [Sandaracinus amylolyticus]|uniref:hypothetical protein n=1 Tax=Sandaracinus amylolyticus TaxID=927083 RepID=UPI001F483D0F|nr:hypothetical protein [Sandaracinus amylolyticus]UJR79364.1 Hypothetical protein I5071_14000 [Sandaracinus amylolyticus]